METVLVGGVGWHWTALNEQWFFMAGGRALTLGGCSVALCGPGAERKAAAVADVNGKWCVCTPVCQTADSARSPTMQNRRANKGPPGMAGRNKPGVSAADRDVSCRAQLAGISPSG